MHPTDHFQKYPQANQFKRSNKHFFRTYVPRSLSWEKPAAKISTEHPLFEPHNDLFLRTPKGNVFLHLISYQYLIWVYLFRPSANFRTKINICAALNVSTLIEFSNILRRNSNKPGDNENIMLALWPSPIAFSINCWWYWMGCVVWPNIFDHITKRFLFL